MMDYKQIKELAHDQGGKVSDYIAMDRDNDPFYVGTPADLVKARWFAAVWKEYGYVSGVHLRRIHYRLFNGIPPGRKPDGTIYENEPWDWRLLGRAALAARHLGLVDASLFIDKFHHAPLIYSDAEREPLDLWASDYVDIERQRLPAFPQLPDYNLNGYEARQPYFIEVWCEKSTMDDVLMPVCKRYGANLITTKGEQSLSGVISCIKRVRADGRNAVILYISDFDPAGKSIPLTASRKFEFYHTDDMPNIQLIPLVLTEQQCIEYKLPRSPIKVKEKRRGSFERQYGKGATELDALEAIHPGLLAKIVSEAIESYRDSTLDARQRECREELTDVLYENRELVLGKYDNEITSLRNEYASIQDEITDKLAAFHTRRDSAWLDMRLDLEAIKPDLHDYPAAEPEAVEGLPDVLFNSDRGYMRQLAIYKKFQGKSDKI